MEQSDTVDNIYMRRCLQLAALGNGHVSPNPMVGAVIVYKGEIIGEGYHRKCGEAHAEVNAINSVKDKSLLKDSVIYVSLEPCSHYGKTPPCSKLIIDVGIPYVVVGILDPFPEVAGRGIKMLRDAGIKVKVGVLENECRALNKRFITSQLFRRPYVILKWAQSADSYIDRIRNESEQATVFSDAVTSALVHKLRAENDAILVGTRTALLDNPTLTVRKWTGKNPLRVVIDRRGILPETLHLFTDGNPTLVFSECKKRVNYKNDIVKIKCGDFSIQGILSELNRMKIQSLIVEGGNIMLNAFIESGLWDECHIEIAPDVLGEGVPAPEFPGVLRYIRSYGNKKIFIFINPDNDFF